MAVSRDANYNPDDALQELLIQKRILECAIDIQSLLRILVDKCIITKDEMQLSRQEVRNSQKYKMAKLHPFPQTHNTHSNSQWSLSSKDLITEE